MGLWPVLIHLLIWELTPTIQTWWAFVFSQVSRKFDECTVADDDELPRVSTADVFLDVESSSS